VFAPRWLIVLPCCLVVTVSAASADSPVPSAQKTTIGDAINLIGEAKGNVVLFHVYASWCPACRMQVPVLNKLSGRYRKHPFKLLTISVDDDPEALAKFQKQEGLQGQPLRLVPGPQDFFAAIKDAGMTEFKDGIPYTAVFDLQGRCIKEFTGVTEFKDFYRLIDHIYIAANPKLKAAEATKEALEKIAAQKSSPAAAPGKFSTVTAAQLGGSERDAGDEDRWAGIPIKHLLIFAGALGGGLLIVAGIVMQIRQVQIRG
jgi:thiol-disulfide isomerase/thioredoxin